MNDDVAHDAHELTVTLDGVLDTTTPAPRWLVWFFVAVCTLGTASLLTLATVFAIALWWR